MTDPDGVVETDTFTCSHCQRIVRVKPLSPPSDVGGFCRVCMKLVCGPCDTKGSCTPWEKTMEIMEAKERLRRNLDAVTR